MQNMDRFHKAWFGRCIKFMKSRKMLITSASHKRGETVRTGGDAGNEAFSIPGGGLLVVIAAGAANLSKSASKGRSGATHRLKQCAANTWIWVALDGSRRKVLAIARRRLAINRLINVSTKVVGAWASIGRSMATHT